jgi:hypothetical protein
MGSRQTCAAAARAALAAALATASLWLIAAPATAQPLTCCYTPLTFDSSTFTGVTGIRGDNMTGNYAIPGTGGSTGGLLFRFSSGAFEPFPTATANGSNFPGAVSSTPYGPTFGAPTGILRVVGSFITSSYQYNQSFLYDGAAAPSAPTIAPDHRPWSAWPSASAVRTIG